MVGDGESTALPVFPEYPEDILRSVPEDQRVDISIVCNPDPLLELDRVETKFETNLVLPESYSISLSGSTVRIKADNSSGLFPISIKYQDTYTGEFFEVKKFSDVPIGTNYQIYNYTPPRSSYLDVGIRVKIIYTDSTTDSKLYYLRVTTDLDINRRLFIEKVNSNRKPING